MYLVYRIKMASRFFSVLFAVAAVLTAAALVAQESGKPESSTPDPEEITRQKLATIQNEIGVLRKQAAQLSERENSVLTQLSQFEVQYEIYTQEIRLLEVKQEKTERDIRNLIEECEQMKKDLEKQKQYLTRRLIEAYKLGEMNYLKLLLKVNQSTDLLRSYQYISFLAKDDDRKVYAYRASLVDLEQTRLRLEQEKRNLAQLKRSWQVARNSLNLNRQEKVRLLSSIRGERSMHMTAMTDLRVAATQLQQFFTVVKPTVIPRTEEKKASIARLKGNLDWPVRGRIIRHFGVYKHPRFGTKTMSNGVEIAAPRGTDVKAVYDGQVVFSEWFKGYGRSVILSHADGYYTLYAHNSELLVQRDQTVRRGQTIARVGSSGGLEGSNPALYFEVRKKDQPMNPVDWLHGR